MKLPDIDGFSGTFSFVNIWLKRKKNSIYTDKKSNLKNSAESSGIRRTAS